MGYIESLREMIGNTPIILVRPSILILNPKGEILLVKHVDETWGVPGGLMEPGESVEECAIREAEEEIGLRIKNLKLYGVFSGQELHTKLRNGHEYYNVVIGYICTEFEGELRPDGIEVLEAAFFNPDHLPERTNPYIKMKIKETAGRIGRLLAEQQ
ncbi:NUDIX domain-containing protein [Paenibacillus oenotherae]|uniref:NUDIX domain-containing protein n=1 Tax=Paenibacillus oenotherae TaxID=1435645 RepID=A0ABS7D4G9_9BACL|nr:NUDIX domain-containing protein [Paenibacillus oenotherae]MBW7474780.1 NUDIX domain-containing protein [Paenibacillus oenotherae]